MLKITKEEISNLSPQEIRNLVADKNAKVGEYNAAIQAYVDLIRKIESDIQHIRSYCHHINVTKSANHYTLDAYLEGTTCDDCGKHWQELVRNENWSKEMKDK